MEIITGERIAAGLAVQAVKVAIEQHQAKVDKELTDPNKGKIINTQA